MKCWVCKRQARGYGHSDLRYPVGDARRYPIDWVFCSRRCQEAFHALYGQWLRVQEGRTPKTEVAMIDPSDVELAAMRKCLKAFGAAAEGIGFEKPLGVYSEAEALRVIDAIVTCYTEAMVEHHEATKYPPVRGLKEPVSDPFADLEDDLPWEEPTAAQKAARKEARR
ncbi:DUF6511 domain-containing protein [Calidifontimicrobium sp. SYSU G02091]|uniref:DUF6511 domain-containing protein n=1 Tax=Calidifontimicrobium sp. SYSU G02091 TaxID=2926421 RepID=UPI001F533673|nr:DUF6511 domain-containing protein [Calidifontimicrobium sp. SYSU G02091]